MLALLLAASAVPLAITAAIAFGSARGLIRASTKELLDARTAVLAAELDAFHDSFLSQCRRLALLPAVRETLAGGPEQRADWKDRLAQVLAAYVTTDARVRGVALFDASGTIVAGTEPPLLGRNYSFRRYFQEAIRGVPVISDVYVAVPEVSSVPSIAYAVPVKDRTQRTVGIAVIFARATAFWELVSAMNGQAGAGSFAVVYDAHGVRIAHSFNSAEVFHPAGALDPATVENMVAERRFGEKTRQLLENPSNVPEEFSRVLRPDPGEFQAYSPANGKVNLGVWHRLKQVPWTLFTLVPVSVLDAPVEKQVRETALANALAIGLALIGGMLLASRILAPVRALTTAADSVRAGRLDARVQADGADELGRLGTTFNSMVEALSAARDDLEGKVRERTAALHGANQELQRSNDELDERTRALQERQARDAAYARALAALTGDGDLGEVLEATLRELGRETRAVVLVCYRLEGGQLLPAGAVGALRDALEAAPVEGVTADVLHTRRLTVVDQIPEDAKLRFDAALAVGRPRSVALVPLCIGDQAAGLLAAGALEPFTPGSLELCAELAVPLALTMARHELHQQTERYAGELAQRNEELRLQASELKLQSEELQAQRLDLEQKNREVQRADRLKSEFLANMSHELRTPLNAIIGFSELLLEDARSSLRTEHMQFVQDILASGRHLLALINDILDLAKIEAGRIELRLAALQPAEAVDEALALVRPQAQRKRIELVATVPETEPAWADGDKLRQVLLNLLSNAIKFSPEAARVEVAVEQDADKLRFSVRDQGPGVDDALLPRLFQPFVQGESPLMKKHQGTGLGLAICKRLVEEQGGLIAVESAPGRGSTFAFTIPVARPGPGKPAVASERVHQLVSPPAGGGARPLVLVAEDDPATARLFHAYLRDGGYEVEQTARAGDVVALAERLRPRAILLDLDLRGEDGLAVLQQLKKHESTRDIPVVIESVNEDRQRGLMLGAADYLVKPLDRRTLLERLARLVPLPQAGERPTVLVIDDDPSVGEVLRPILSAAGYQLLAAGLGKEGLQIAARERPALAVVDLLLPDISGFDVLDALASDERTRELPVLVLTAADLSESQRERLRTRVSALAQKGDFTREAVLAAVARATGAAGPQPPPVNGAHILVVDDHDLNRELVRTVLERRGYRVSVAEDGESGAQLARRERPSLIILDLAMPRKDGIAAARELKADPELASTPLVALTAMAMRGDEARAREAGFDAYLTKPVVRRDLEETVARLLRRQGVERT